MQPEITPASTTQPKRGFFKRFGVSVAVIALGITALLAGELLGIQILKFLVPVLGGFSDTQQQFTAYLIGQTLVALLLILVARLLRARKGELGLGKITRWAYLLTVPILYFICLLVSVVVISSLIQFLPQFDAQQVQDIGLAPVGQTDLIVAGIFLAVVVPLAEEFIFRGYLYGLLRRQMSFWLTTIIVSAIFAFAHGQWNVAIDVFILSIALCFLREKTGSIWVGVLLHALKNFIAFLLLFVYNVV